TCAGAASDGHDRGDGDVCRRIGRRGSAGRAGPSDRERAHQPAVLIVGRLLMAARGSSCTRCGASVPEATSICPRCGAAIPVEARGPATAVAATRVRSKEGAPDALLDALRKATLGE